MQKQQPDSSLPWPYQYAGVLLLTDSEQCRLKAYPDPVTGGKPWTIGWGETEGVSPGDVWTQEQADRRLCNELATKYIPLVKAALTVEPTEHELAALVSIAYNCEAAVSKASSIIRAHNRGDKASAARAFKLYDKSVVNGKMVEVPGLLARRMREAAYYLTPDEHMEQPAPAQVVATESHPAASPINQASTVTAITGGLTLVSSLSDQFNDAAKKIADLAQTFGLNGQTVLGIALLTAGSIALYYRIKQRREGWV